MAEVEANLDKQKRSVAKYYIKEGYDGVATIYPNGSIGFGKYIEDANFSATFFPAPSAALNLERGWRELTPEQIPIFEKPKTP